MNKNFILILIVASCFMVLFSCKQKQSTAMYQASAGDSDYSFHIDQFDQVNHFALDLINTSSGTAEFYITPEAINLFSDSTIIAGLLHPGMKERDKCLALWKFICNWTYHGEPLSSVDQQINDPAVLLNGFEVGICDDRNAALSNLARLAHIPSRIYSLKGHVVSELYYDNSWHMFDADKHLYYTSPEGEIASVDYLAIHPEIIEAKNTEMTAFIEKLRNNRTKAAIISTADNEISGFYDITKSDYSAAIRLNEGDRLSLGTEPVSNFHRWYSIILMKRSGPLSNRTGTWLSHISRGSASFDGSAANIFTLQLPYPIQHVKLTLNRNYRVYYSYDMERWYFKGITGKNLSCVTFVPFNKSGATFVFKYYIKLLPGDSSDRSTGGECIIESKFTFSDHILVHNQDHAFRVVPLNEAARRMNVRMQSEW